MATEQNQMNERETAQAASNDPIKDRKNDAEQNDTAFQDAHSEVAEASDQKGSEESDRKKGKNRKKNEEAEKLIQENQQLAEDNAKLKDQLLRQMAEFDNFRKRTARERENTFSDAVLKTVKPLVDVLDSFERALQSPCADEAYQKGMQMLFAQLHDTLEKLGVKEIEAQGQMLDPALHCAVMQGEQEGIPAGQVLQVLQKGYLLGDRVIRCAMVSVAK